MNKSILIFGSAFNPPTLAHEAIIAACLGLPQFDEVWLMPSGDRLDKSMSVSDSNRMRMAEILKSERFAGDSRIKVTDFELKLPRPTETYQTVAALSKAYPDLVFWWALGTDSYLSMPGWSHGLELQQNLKLLIFDRGGENKPHNSNVMHLVLPSSLLGVSSTEARNAIISDKPIDRLVSEPIARYVLDNQLYG